MKELTLKETFYELFADLIFKISITSIETLLKELSKDLNQDMRFVLEQNGSGHIGYFDRGKGQVSYMKNIVSFKGEVDFINKLKEYCDTTT